MNIHFVLVEPTVPENIGAAARAIKTMGFASLVLVHPNNFPHEKATWLAHGSTEVLDQAQVSGSFHEAIRHFDFIVGTTARKRSVKVDYHSPDRLLKILRDKGATINNIAIAFGREESGLTNEELGLCDLVSTIPMTAPYPSLNLAQAVMVYAYVLSPLALSITSNNKTAPDQSSFVMLKQKVDGILFFTGVKKNATLYNRIMERLDHVGEDDIHLLHSICNGISNQLRDERKA
jgi:tRNA/rRNA methyltransferase